MQPHDISAGRVGTLLGTLLTSVFGIAAVLATLPLFVLGVFGAGLVAATAISASSAYVFGEVLHTGHSLNRPLPEAWLVYSIPLGTACLAADLVLIPNAPLEFIILIVNVIAVVAMPPALLLLSLLVNDPEVMGKYANGKWANCATVSITVLLLGAGLVYALATVFPA